MGKDTEAGEPQSLFDLCKIVVKKSVKHFQIVFEKLIHTPLVFSHPLRYEGKRRLCRRQQKSQVIMPEVVIEAVSGRKIQETIHLHQHFCPKRLPFSFPLPGL